MYSRVLAANRRGSTCLSLQHQNKLHALLIFDVQLPIKAGFGMETAHTHSEQTMNKQLFVPALG